MDDEIRYGEAISNVYTLKRTRTVHVRYPLVDDGWRSSIRGLWRHGFNSTAARVLQLLVTSVKRGDIHSVGAFFPSNSSI